MFLIRSINILKDAILDFKNSKFKNFIHIFCAVIAILMFLYASYAIIMCYIKYGLFDTTAKLDLIEHKYTNNLYLFICSFAIFVSFILVFINYFINQKNKLLKFFSLFIIILLILSSIPCIAFILEEIDIISFEGYYRNELIIIPKKYIPLFLFYKNSPAEALVCYKYCMFIFAVTLLVGIFMIFKKEKKELSLVILNIIYIFVLTLLIMIVSNIVRLAILLGVFIAVSLFLASTSKSVDDIIQYSATLERIKTYWYLYR